MARRGHGEGSIYQQTMKQFLTQWLEDHKSSIRVRSYERYEELVRLHIIPALSPASRSCRGTRDCLALKCGMGVFDSLPRLLLLPGQPAVAHTLADQRTPGQQVA